MTTLSETATSRQHSYRIRVYYEDTDAAGIVYYANYLKFAERARTEMLRDLGADHRRLQQELDLSFVVKRCAAEYHRPARLDDWLDVRTCMTRLGRASLDLAQQVYRDNDLLASLDVRLALLNRKMRPVRLPPILIAALAPQYLC